MNNKTINFIVLALLLSGAIINNLDSLYTAFKTVFNSFAMIVFVVIAFERLYKWKRDKKIST
jgi:hypothetical protein